MLSANKYAIMHTRNIILCDRCLLVDALAVIASFFLWSLTLCLSFLLSLAPLSHFICSVLVLQKQSFFVLLTFRTVYFLLIVRFSTAPTKFNHFYHF